MDKIAALAAGVLLALPLSGNAYEVRTHQKLTRTAFAASVLADTHGGPLNALDITDPQQKFTSIPSSNFDPEIATAEELVGLGAVYEDHPEKELRFTNHFFDPQQNGRGMLNLGIPSPAWILEAGDPNGIPRQQYSLMDAIEFHRQALTLNTREARMRPKVLLLETLGRAVHHLQDMAQPAHTRDDIHPPWDGDAYEAMTEDLFVAQNRPLPLAQTCGEGPVDLNQFDLYMKFWTLGRGMADFTADNFVSKDTNFRPLPGSLDGGTTDGVHPLPAFPSSPVFDTPTAASLGIQGVAPNSRLQFLGLPIVDNNSGSGCFNPRAAMRTLSSDWARLVNMPVATTSYALNSYTYEQNYRILFPRAVAYSAALLDYYFRGRMEVVSYSVVNGQVQLVIRNVSAGQFAFRPDSDEEEFSVYYDAQNGQRRRLPLQGDDPTQPIEKGATYSLSFPMPADVDPTLEQPFTLVYHGTIGVEAGIAAIKVGDPTGAFLVTPNYVPADGIAGPRMIAQREGGWVPSPTVGATAGNVDWHGASGDILTWDGPQGRYFGAAVSSPNIYQGGRVLTVAPGEVIGAAITSQGSQRFLIAAVALDGLKIYRRPYQATYSRNDLYDELNNPGGWQLVHSLQIYPSSPLFFNASGTQGQVFNGPLVRYRIQVSGGSVTSQQISNIGSIKTTRSEKQDINGGAETNPGPPLACSARGSRCVGERGSCTTPDGYHSTNVCLVAEADEDVTDGLVRQNLATRANIKSTVVCADYRGDTEVLCVVESDETGDRYDMSSVGHWTSRRFTNTDQACGITQTGNQLYDHNFDEVETGWPVMRFRVGSVTIPLSGTSYHREKHYHSVWNWDGGAQGEREATVGYSYSAEDIDYDSKLLYVDARNGIVAYEDHQVITTRSGTGSAASYSIEVYGADRQFLARLAASQKSISRVVVHADAEYELSKRTTEGPEEVADYQENTGFKYFPPEHCLDYPATSNVSEETKDWSPYEFAASLHPRLGEEVSQSLSALSTNQFVASFPIWIRQPDNSYVREGTWNHLSGGDLATVLPGATASAEYVRTGIAR